MGVSKPFKVLVADDTPANRTLLRAYLGRLGFETVMAENGLEAVSQFESTQPDIVLMDLMMPIMDGFEAIERIRELPGKYWVPIFVVSAMDAESDVVRGLEAGADDYLTKPLSYQVFAAKMRNMARALTFQRTQEEATRREIAVADAVIDGIVTFDAQGSIIGLNRAARQIFGVAPDALTGQHVASLISEQGRPTFALDLARGLEDGVGNLIGRVLEVMASAPTGRRFPMELSINPLPTLDRRLFIGVVRDISERKQFEEQLAEDAARLRQYHDEAESEAELAKEILDRHIRRQDVDTRGSHQRVLPAARFSGDIVLAARSPSGKLYGLLADATGHGLAAAMSGLSVVGHFYQSVAADASVESMIHGINASLLALLPPGRFVSTAIVRVDDATHSGEIWLGGVPDVLLLDPQHALHQRFASMHLPLGITEMSVEEAQPQSFQWPSSGSHLLLCSDGVLEASRGGEEFGYGGLTAALRRSDDSNPLDVLTAALGEHLQGESAHDDASFLLLDLT